MRRSRSAIATTLALILALGLVSAAPPPPPAPPPDCAGARAADCRPVVVLLHGLARSPTSMRPLARGLEAAGWRVCNLEYASRKAPIAVLAAQLRPEIQACLGDDPRPPAFVTHSLGGILVRQLRADDPGLRFGRVVMLGPPNAGSEVVDTLGGWRPFVWINGPAGLQIGTDAGSIPRRLGATDLDVGVIAGEASINLVLSQMIPGADDGKVSLASARLAGMRDFLVVPVSHPFLMSDEDVIRQVQFYLQHGAFAREPGQ